MTLASAAAIFPRPALEGAVPAILRATLVAGTLDILSAFAFNGMAGVGPGRVLRFIASGPFGDSLRDGGAGAAVIGLATHFALMAVMTSLFVLAAVAFPSLRRGWPWAGAAYGVAIYLVMYWLVVPLRFGFGPRVDAWGVGNALFSHILCVGLPIAWITQWSLARR